MNISRPRLRLPSPALILSCVALFTALGGGAYAATSLGHTALQWHKATFQNGWKPYAANYARPGYAKDANGVVHLRGGVKGGGNHTAVFTLPVGYRPSHYIYIEIYTLNTAAGGLQISPNGAVEPFGGSATDYSSLDGISFVAGE